MMAKLTKNQSPTRAFAKVPETEVRDAVIEMCLKLGISTSSHGYNLIGTVLEEHRKAIEAKDLFEELGRDIK